MLELRSAFLSFVVKHKDDMMGLDRPPATANGREDVKATVKF